MPNDVVGNLVRVTVAYQYPDSQIIENNINYHCDVAGGSDTRSALAAAVAAIFTAQYGAMIPVAASQYGAKAANVNLVPTPAPAVVYTGTAGTGANPGCPTQARPLLRFKTVLTGRKYRGRLFLPPPSTAFVNNAGFPNGALVVATNNLGAALVSNITLSGSTWAPVILHRVPHQPLLATFNYIFNYANPVQFATQWKSGNTGRINVSPF